MGKYWQKGKIGTDSSTGQIHGKENWGMRVGGRIMVAANGINGFRCECCGKHKEVNAVVHLIE
jgi:predicted sulfurtransferase